MRRGDGSRVSLLDQRDGFLNSLWTTEAEATGEQYPIASYILGVQSG
ncbi:hypothetical protein [Syntrophaceticus schinkii]|nr:hypothetical protein [Syntrophaceticus schinkii]